LGGAGFIGSHVVDELLALGSEVRVFARRGRETPNLNGVRERIDLVTGDFTNEYDIRKAVSGVDTVVHLICTTLPKSSNEDFTYDLETNLISTLRLMTISVSAGVRRFVFASSGGTVYGETGPLPVNEDHATDPICSYGVGKLTIEKYLHLFERLYGLNYTIIRPGNPYGERQKPLADFGAVNTFIRKVIKREAITIWGDGTLVRDYFHVSDLARLFAMVAMAERLPGRIYNAGSGTALSLNQLLERIQHVTGMAAMVKYDTARKFDAPISCLDVTRAKRDLSWIPAIQLDEGISRTMRWINNDRGTGINTVL